MFPNNSEFVIAIGFQGEKVRDYLKLVYPQKKIKFVKIKKFQGSGSGLTRTLFESKKYLQEPFYFISCDTIIKGKIQKAIITGLVFRDQSLAKVIEEFY